MIIDSRMDLRSTWKGSGDRRRFVAALYCRLLLGEACGLRSRREQTHPMNRMFMCRYCTTVDLEIER